MKVIARSGLVAAEDLRRTLRGKVVLPGDEAYAVARQLWNGAVDRYPALFVVCETAKDVAAAVRTARAHGLSLSVLGGGHDWAGSALCEDGMVIDLRAMRQVEVDPVTGVATLGGGARASDVVAAAAPHGLAAVTGAVGSVGMVGLTLGGGYGPLTPRFGLALDNLLDADLVLADGRHIVVDRLDHPELLWALRGGGGNFGVVTSMRIRLHRLDALLAGFMLFPWPQAAMVLRGYAEALAEAPDELDVMAWILPGPDGEPLLSLAATWTGDERHGAQIMDDLQHLGTPLSAEIGALSYSGLLRLFGAPLVRGRHYAMRARCLPELTPAAIAALVAAGDSRTSRSSAIAIRHFHGAPARVPPAATAFGLRREHFVVEIIAGWPAADSNGPTHRRWACNLSRALAPMALPGGYPNLLASDDEDQIAVAYGRNIAGLRGVKRLFDPDGVFAATPLPDGEIASRLVRGRL
jgi:FAD/FMN-containing dehydrogenase